MDEVLQLYHEYNASEPLAKVTISWFNSWSIRDAFESLSWIVYISVPCKNIDFSLIFEGTKAIESYFKNELRGTDCIATISGLHADRIVVEIVHILRWFRYKI